MSIPTYVLGYPQDGSSLGNTRVQIRKNLDGTFETLSVDHQNQNETNPGYHAIIHQETQSVVNTVANINQVFSGIPGTLSVNATTTPAIPSNGDTQLYALTGMGGLSQLTGHSAATNGYVWCSGILIQWGNVVSNSTTGIVSFSPNFPNSCFNIQCTPIVSSSTSHVSTIYPQTGFSSSGFTWFQADRASSQVGFNWVAIGN